jgi:hypothetical protein
MNGSGPDGPIETFQTTRVEYRDRWHWRVVLLEHTQAPDVVGTTHTLAGDTMTMHQSRMAPPGQGRSWVVPPELRRNSPPFGLRWEPPSYIEIHTGKPGYAIRRLDDGLALLRRTAVCNGYLVRTETMFRLGDGIPLRQVQFVNGVPNLRYEVLELEFGTAALARVQAQPLPTAAPMPPPRPQPAVPGWPTEN